MAGRSEFMPPQERARRARSFASVAGEYDRGRPGYPAAAVSWVLPDAPVDVLDVGAGTGKLTAALVRAGHRVVAVEPLAEMRGVLQSQLPAVRVLDGAAERLPLARGSVDAVVAGAAFHWFDQEAALTEALRVLRSPGVLALFGNSFDTTVPWLAELRGILGPATLGRPGHWPEPERLHADFEDVQEREFAHTQNRTLAQLRDYASSRSGFAVIPEAEREQRLREIDALWARTPELGGAATAAIRWVTRVRRCTGVRGLRPR